MTIVDLIMMLISISLGILKDKLTGGAQADAKIADGTLKLIQVSLQIHAEHKGLPIDDVIEGLAPFEPIVIPPAPAAPR